MRVLALRYPVLRLRTTQDRHACRNYTPQETYNTLVSLKAIPSAVAHRAKPSKTPLWNFEKAIIGGVFIEGLWNFDFSPHGSGSRRKASGQQRLYATVLNTIRQVLQFHLFVRVEGPLRNPDPPLSIDTDQHCYQGRPENVGSMLTVPEFTALEAIRDECNNLIDQDIIPRIVSMQADTSNLEFLYEMCKLVYNYPPERKCESTKRGAGLPREVFELADYSPIVGMLALEQGANAAVLLNVFSRARLKLQTFKQDIELFSPVD